MTIQEFHPERPIHVIPNFVNCDVYLPLDEAVRTAGRARYAEPGEKILLHLSNFRPVKRTADVIRIFSRIARELPARLLMVGDGPDRSAAEWLAHREGIQDRVHFLGKQSSVSEILPLADLLLMPSELESFGLAALAITPYGDLDRANYICNGVFSCLPASCGVSLGYGNWPLTFVNKREFAPPTHQLVNEAKADADFLAKRAWNRSDRSPAFRCGRRW